MDNSYYTGATLIRTGTSNGGGGNNSIQSKYISLTSTGSPPIQSCAINVPTTGGPPLVLQPNLLTGLPLIRNGQHLQAAGHMGHPHGPNGHVLRHTSQGQVPQGAPPPGVICCFQPIYYIPAPSPPAAVYNNPPPLLLPPQSNNNKPNGNAGFQMPSHSGKLAQAPKRKNYKSLSNQQMKLKPMLSPLPPLNPGNIKILDQHSAFKYHHPKLTLSSSFPDPISPPPKLAHQVLSRTTSTSHFFSSKIESTRPTSEEKQRNDKLLNFYFYEKHWRPREDENYAWTESGTGQNLEDKSWDIIQQKVTPKTEYPLPLPLTKGKPSANSEFNRQPGAGRTLTSSPSTILKQQKDLEVEAQIITLANGHRDLEIRLCYVTS